MKKGSFFSCFALFLFGIIFSGFLSQIEAQSMVPINKIAGHKLAVNQGSASGIYENQVFDIVRMNANNQEFVEEAQVLLVKDDASALKVAKLNPYQKVQAGDMLVSKQSPGNDQTSNAGSFGLRGGIGTDISGGIAYGAAINYLFPTGNHPFEVGLSIYGGSFEETTEEFHTYVETTDIFVIGVLGNYLIDYQPGRQGMFFVTGVGIGAISMEWQETSKTDESLGTPLPGGGSKQDAEGSGAGMLLNLGIGYQLQGNFDVRFEIPIFVVFDAPAGASSFIPTFTLTAGLRFR